MSDTPRTDAARLARDIAIKQLKIAIDQYYRWRDKAEAAEATVANLEQRLHEVADDRKRIKVELAAERTAREQAERVQAVLSKSRNEACCIGRKYAKDAQEWKHRAEAAEA